MTNVIQCLQILLTEMKGKLEDSLNNTVTMVNNMNPEEEENYVNIWNMRDQIQQIWQHPHIQVHIWDQVSQKKHDQVFDHEHQS